MKQTETRDKYFLSSLLEQSKRAYSVVTLVQIASLITVVVIVAPAAI